MDCTKALELIDGFADAELDEAARNELREHLSECGSCGAVARETQQLKRLVQRKAFQVPIPGGLAARILERVSDEKRPPVIVRLRGPITALAAAILVTVSLWSFFAEVDYEPVEHHALAGVMEERFEEVNAAPGQIITDLDTALAEMRRQTGMRLVSLPNIPEARPVAWKQDRILERPCLCVSYEDLSSAIDVPEGESAPRFVVFAIPSDKSEFAGNRHVCTCVQMSGQTMIYCFRMSGVGMSVVAPKCIRKELEKRLDRVVEEAIIR